MDYNTLKKKELQEECLKNKIVFEEKDTRPILIKKLEDFKKVEKDVKEFPEKPKDELKDESKKCKVVARYFTKHHWRFLGEFDSEEIARRMAETKGIKELEIIPKK